MIDNQFDNFLNDKLKDHSAPVPAGLWNKVKDSQFDNFIGDTFKDHIAPVPTGLWDKVTDSQFDQFFGNTFNGHTAPVPGNLWDKITDGQFDNFIAGKLIDHTAAVPTGLWKKVQPKEDHDRKGFIFFRYPYAALVLLALLLGGSLVGYLYITSQNDSDATEVKVKQGSSTTNGKEKMQEPVILENNTLSTTPSTSNTPTSAQQKNNGPTDQPMNDPLTTGTSKSITHNASGRLTNDVKSNHVPAGQQSSTAGNSHTPSTINPTKGLDVKPNNSNTVNGIPVYKDDILNSNINNMAISKTIATEDTESENIAPYQRNLLTAVTIPTDGNRFNGLQSLLDKQLATTNHTSKFRNVVICPADKKNRNTDWHFETYLSPDFASKSVITKTASQQFLLKKDSSESMQIGYSAGLRLVKPLTENIILKAGVQYTQMNEKYVYRTENEVKTITVVTVRTIIRAPGDTVIVRDTSILQQIGFHNNTVYNRFRSFDIPVTVGYQFGNEDLKFGINAGVIFNVSSWYQGVILDSTLATVPLVKGNGSMVFKSNIGLGIYGGISIIKRLSDDLHVFVEPYFRYNLSNMTNTQSSYNQKFSLGGLSIGLRFNLTRQ